MKFRSTIVAVAAMASLIAPNARAEGVIRLGFLSAMTGPVASLTGEGSLAAVRMAIADAGGELLGKKIELLVADHLSKPDAGLTIAREWIDTKDVKLLFSVDHSAVALAVSDLIKDRDVTMMLGASATPLVNEKCGPHQIMMLLDGTALARSVTKPQVKAGHNKWFFIAVNFAMGKDLTAAAETEIKAAGGTVVGAAFHAPDATDFSSFLLEAQAKGANTIGLATYGAYQNAIIKQAQEFGIKAVIAPFYLGTTDIQATGLESVQNVTGTILSYWDQNDQSRQFSKRFATAFGQPPTFTNTYAYEYVAHYLNAIKATGSMDADKINQWMRETPMPLVNGATATIRRDGSTLRDVYTYETKRPSESKGPWDFLKITSTVPAADIATPLSQSKCPLVKG
jgi:branched-chain amino acid transport system substrate-binding protein